MLVMATSLPMTIYSRDWFNPGAALVEKLAGIEERWLALQEEISREVAQTLRQRLNNTEQTQLAKRQTQNRWVIVY